MPDVKRRALENGLRLVVAEVPSLPTFAAILSVDAGSRYEEEDTAGVAALTSALLVERPGAAGAALDLRVDALGLSLDAVGGYETTALIATGPSARSVDALSVLHEIVAFPLFGSSMVEDAIDRQLTEIAEEEDDPYCVCRNALFEEIFGSHARGRPTVGYDRTVRRLCLEHVEEYHDARYRPGHAVLSVVGDFDSQRILDEASSIFRSWTGRGAPDRERPSPDPPREARSRFVSMDRAQVHLAIGGLGIRRSDPAYYAVVVMDAILGDGAGFGSRLASRLREDAGLAYLVESDAASTSGLDPGAFWVYTATSPSRVGAALDAVRDELRRIRTLPPSPGELASAKAYVRGRELLGLETNEARAARLVQIERYELGHDYGDRFATLVEAVSAEDVLTAARRVIDVDRAASVLVGPPGASVHL